MFMFQPLNAKTNTNTNGQTLLKECPLSVSSVVAEGQQYVSTRARNWARRSSGDLKPQVLPCFSEQRWWSLFGDFYWSPKKDQFMITSVSLSSSFKIFLFAVSSVHSSRQGWQRQLTTAMHWKTQQLTIDHCIERPNNYVARHSLRPVCDLMIDHCKEQLCCKTQSAHALKPSDGDDDDDCKTQLGML